MAIQWRRRACGAVGFVRNLASGMLALGVALFLTAATGNANGWNHADLPWCSITAGQQYRACTHEIRDDLYEARAICTNLEDDDERAECHADAWEDFGDNNELCRDQRQARNELCGLIGQDRYEPDFDPELFDDDFDDLTNPNPYFPLAIGNVWVYESEDGGNTVEVLDKTKLIEGVTCIVVNDLVEEDNVQEDTDDWYAQREDGTVDYCGEESKDKEFFPGDDPQEAELVEIEGSFKAGRDGDKPGTIFLANPVVGTTYRQEWSAGNAEDAATVVSTTYGWGGGAGELDAFVPQELAEAMCPDDDCAVTRDFTPIDPGEVELKYYAKDVGLFLEVKPEDGAINELVSCNFGGKCNDL